MLFVKLRHVWMTLYVLAFGISATAVVLGVVAGNWLVVAQYGTLLGVVWFVSRRYLPHARRSAHTKQDRVLYREAEKLIFGMQPMQPYRSSGDVVLLLRQRQPWRSARVMRVVHDGAELPQIDQLGFVVSETFTLLPWPPLVHRSVQGDRVDLGEDDELVAVEDTADRNRIADAHREMRLMAKTGMNQASSDELRTLVEQLRSATLVEN